jgi:hypothetical protein
MQEVAMILSMAVQEVDINRVITFNHQFVITFATINIGTG